MKRALLLLMVLLLFGGCVSPEKRLALCQQSFTSAANGAVVARNAGIIDDVNWQLVKVGTASAHAAITAYEAALERGDPEWKVYLEAAEAALERAIELYQQAVKEKEISRGTSYPRIAFTLVA